jgi:hypothetical protein
MTLCSRNYLITSRKVPRSEIMCTEWRGEDCPIISAWRAYVRGDFRRKTQAIKYPTVPSRVQIGTLEVCHPLSPRQARRFRCAPNPDILLRRGSDAKGQGAFRTPAVRARGWFRKSGVRKPAQSRHHPRPLCVNVGVDAPVESRREQLNRNRSQSVAWLNWRSPAHFACRSLCLTGPHRQRDLFH